MYLLGTLLCFHEEESDGWKNLHTANTPELGTPVVGAPSVTDWTIASCKVINITDPSKLYFIVLSTSPPLKVFRHFNWAKLPRMWKISSHDFDIALLIINSNWTNKHLNIFNDSIGFAWMQCSYVHILKSFSLFVLEISQVKFIMVRIFRNSQ